MALRIAVAVLLLIPACALPVVVTIVFGIFALVLYKDFYELVPIFFLNDALYGISMHRFAGFPFVMTLLAIVLVLLSVFLRRSLFDTTRLGQFR